MQRRRQLAHVNEVTRGFKLKLPGYDLDQDVIRVGHFLLLPGKLTIRRRFFLTWQDSDPLINPFLAQLPETALHTLLMNDMPVASIPLARLYGTLVHHHYGLTEPTENNEFAPDVLNVFWSNVLTVRSKSDLANRLHMGLSDRMSPGETMAIVTALMSRYPVLSIARDTSLYPQLTTHIVDLSLTVLLDAHAHGIAVMSHSGALIVPANRKTDVEDLISVHLERLMHKLDDRLGRSKIFVPHMEGEGGAAG